MRKIDWLICAFLLFASLFALKDLFQAGFFTSHDGPHQVVRFYYFDKLLREGQIPPRFVPQLLSGFGYPLFIFSYHMPWYIAELFHIVGFDIIWSIKMTFLAGFFLSGVFMYLFQKHLFGRLAAFVGAILYMFAPFRFSNIFVRAAIGDATTFIFLPLIFFSLYRLKTSTAYNVKYMSLGAIALAGLLLSHAMIFSFVALALFFYVAFSIFWQRKFHWIWQVCVSGILAIGLSSYYFFPSFIERYNTNASEILRSVYSGKTFLTIGKLLYSPWWYGTMDAFEGAMSFQLGIAQWLVFAFMGLFLLFLLARYRMKHVYSHIITGEAIFFFTLTLSTIFLMLAVSRPFWQLVEGILVIDFPWRILPLTIFSISVLGGFLLRYLPYPYICAFLFITLSFYANRNHLKINLPVHWPVSFYLQLEETTNSFNEYIPKWFPRDKREKIEQKVSFSSTSATISNVESNSKTITFHLETSQDGIVTVQSMYYPGWQLFVQNKKRDILAGAGGLMEFPLSAGVWDIRLEFQETFLRRISNLISLLTVFFTMFLLRRIYVKG